MTENRKMTPTRDEEEESQKQHEKTDSRLSLMESETFKNLLERIGFQERIELCCTHEILSDTIRKLDPRIDEVCKLLDLNKIYGHKLYLNVIWECVDHFKPHTVVVQATFDFGLPVHFLNLFSIFSINKLIIRINVENQQFLVYHFKIREIRFEHPDDDPYRSSNALNSVIQSSGYVETLELVNCALNDVTIACLVKSYIRDLTLCNCFHLFDGSYP